MLEQKRDICDTLNVTGLQICPSKLQVALRLSRPAPRQLPMPQTPALPPAAGLVGAEEKTLPVVGGANAHTTRYKASILRWAWLPTLGNAASCHILSPGIG